MKYIAAACGMAEQDVVSATLHVVQDAITPNDGYTSFVIALSTPIFTTFCAFGPITQKPPQPGPEAVIWQEGIDGPLFVDDVVTVNGFVYVSGFINRTSSTTVVLNRFTGQNTFQFARYPKDSKSYPGVIIPNTLSATNATLRAACPGGPGPVSVLAQQVRGVLIAYCASAPQITVWTSNVPAHSSPGRIDVFRAITCVDFDSGLTLLEAETGSVLGTIPSRPAFQPSVTYNNGAGALVWITSIYGGVRGFRVESSGDSVGDSMTAGEIALIAIVVLLVVALGAVVVVECVIKDRRRVVTEESVNHEREPEEGYSTFK